MEVPRPAYGFEFGEAPKDIRSAYDVIVVGLGGTHPPPASPECHMRVGGRGST
jgi:hypothetical protein